MVFAQHPIGILCMTIPNFLSKASRTKGLYILVEHRDFFVSPPREGILGLETFSRHAEDMGYPGLGRKEARWVSGLRADEMVRGTCTGGGLGGENGMESAGWLVRLWCF